MECHTEHGRNKDFWNSATGNVIDYREVKARLIWGVQTFHVEEICFDPYNSRQLSTQLIDEGYECVEIRQGYATLAEPSKKILELVASGKLRHGGHPILRWNASCLSTKEINDCLMFAKPSGRRILRALMECQPRRMQWLARCYRFRKV